MDSQTKKYLFIALGAILLIGGALFYFFGSPFSWNESFREDDKNPYGTSVLTEVLKKSVGEKAFHLVNSDPLDTLTKIDIDTLPENSTYIFVGEQLFLDDSEIEYLLNFASEGHSVYFLSKQFNSQLLDSLFLHPKVLIAELIDKSYTPLDDRSVERIPCGYYDRYNIWHQTNYENPNGYLDIKGDWRELKPKDYDGEEYYLDETFEFEDDLEETSADEYDEDDYYEEEYEEEIESDNYDEDGYWIDEYVVEEEEYDAEADTIGYYGRDGIWIRQDSTTLASEANYNNYGKYYYDYSDSYVGYILDSVAFFNFDNPELDNQSLETVKIYQNTPVDYTWNYFVQEVLDDTLVNLSKLGNFTVSNDPELYTNFIRLEYGKGQIYMHTTPLMFTNYMVIKEPYFAYSQEVFSHMGDGYVIWDESVRYPDEIEFENDLTNPKYQPDKGPLTFILSEPSLKWAWYTLLIALILYMFFGLRRKQRPIPVTIPNKNTSKAYAETIGQLYMSKKKHNDIYRLKMSLFKSFLRDRYSINVPENTKGMNSEIIDAITIKSDVSLQHVTDIFKTYDSTFFREYITTQELVYFHDLLEEFYKKCK